MTYRNYFLMSAVALLLTLFTPITQAEETGDREPLKPFAMDAVTVGGEIGRRIDITGNNNLLQLDYDADFLPEFNPKGERHGNYIGLGRTFDAVTRIAKNTQNEKLIELRKKLLETMLSYQEEDGYLGTFAPDEGLRIARLWDIHEMSSVTKSLVADYTCWGDPRSLEAAKRIIDYIIKNYDKATTGNMDGIVANFASFEEFENAVLLVAKASGEDRYWQFIRDKRETPPWSSPIILGRDIGVLGHTTAYLERCVAQLNLYLITGDPNLLDASKVALDFMVSGEGMTVTGATSQTEIWTDDQDGRFELGEVCALANQIKLFDMYIRLEESALCGDLMERTIYNNFFASQSPDGRQLRYYTPFEGERQYFWTDTYCCPGIYRRTVAELPQMIYYQTNKGLAVNLYGQSVLRATLAEGTDLTLTQETDYPNSGHIVFKLGLPEGEGKDFAIDFRIPHFAEGATLAVNGEVFSEGLAGSQFFRVERTWSDGDEVTLEFPMEWRLVKGRVRQAGRVCIMRGPLVYCLDHIAFEQTKDQDSASAGLYYLNPDSLGELLHDETIRPDGTAVEVELCPPGAALDFANGFKVLFKEFPDPFAEVTYFKLRNYAPAIDDTLFVRKESMTPPNRGICAHRGAQDTHPENTVPAFRQAAALGAPQIEFDVQTTSDGQFVVMHDPSVDRTTNGTGNITSMTFAEIRALDAGIKKGEAFEGTSVPTFDEAIDSIPAGIWINVHLNDYVDAAAIAERIRLKGRLAQTFLACTLKQAAAARAVCPEIKICNMDRQPEVADYVTQTIENECDFIQLIRDSYTQEDLDRLHKAGVRINVFGIPAQDEEAGRKSLQAMFEEGVDFPLVDSTQAMFDAAKEILAEK